MALSVRGVFDLGRGLAVGDPRQDEARAREASARSEKDLRSTIAGRLVNQQVQQRQLELQAADLAQRAQSEQQRMAQQESQFSRGQQFQSGESALERAFRERMQQEGFGFESEQRGLDRGQQESQFGRSFGLEQRGQEMMKDQFEQRMGLERDQFGFTKERAGVEDARFSKTFGYTQQRDKEQDQWMRDRAKVEDVRWGKDYEQRGEQFDTNEQNEMLRHLADRQAQQDAQQQARQDSFRSEAHKVLGQYSDAILRGETLSDEAKAEIRALGLFMPEAKEEIDRILRSTSETVHRRYEQRDRGRVLTLGGVPVAEANLYRNPTLEWLGLTSTLEQDRDQALRDRGVDPREPRQIQVPTQSAPQVDRIYEMLLQAAQGRR